MIDSHGYKLSDINIKLVNSQIVNIKGLISEFTIYESVDSPAVRAEFLVADATDFINALRGSEEINLTLRTDSSESIEYKLVHKIYKIGSNFKSERMQQYILHTVSNEAINNERVKVFKTFKGSASSTVKDVLKKSLATNKKLFIEDTIGNFPFISPSWRPYDCISYLSDKVLRSKNQEQGGFLFFENRDGIHFESIDGLIEKGKEGISKQATVSGNRTNTIRTFTYKQKNVVQPGDNYYNIESITYPDKYDLVTNMRSGALGNSFIGVDIQSINQSQLPKSSKSSASASDDPKGPGGGDYFVVAKSANKYWGLFSHIDDASPFPGNPQIDGDGQRKRFRFFSESNFDNGAAGSNTPNLQTSNAARKNETTAGSAESTGTTNKGGAGGQPGRIIRSSLYSLMRYHAINYVKLNITVAGNVGVTVGDVINIVLPKARESELNLDRDKTYSGYYLVLGVVHTWRPEGVTTSLLIGRDSLGTKKG